MNLRQLGKIHWKDVISPKKWMSVFRAKRLETEIRFWEVEVFVYYTLEHPRSPMLKEEKRIRYYEAEQLIYRTVTCKPCMDQGYCEYCGCSMPSKAMDFKASCFNDQTGLRWGPVLNEQDWKAYKDHWGMEIKLGYNVPNADPYYFGYNQQRWQEYKKEVGLGLRFVVEPQ